MVLITEFFSSKIKNGVEHRIFYFVKNILLSKKQNKNKKK